MHDPLAPLLADGVIDEVAARLKSGKEADLWLVRHAGELLAAKVYKAREARNFKNNSGYTEGRQVRNTRTQRAMDRGTRFGVAASEEAWKAKESDALHQLHAAGVRVPRPVLFYEGVLLMEVVVDAEGHPAPRLVDAHVTRDNAAALYADLRSQAVRMLCCDLVHGDLSPYNVLLAWNGPVVIDFPQVVGAAHNSQAERFFLRDVENLRRFFAQADPSLERAANDGHEIWRAYVRRRLTPEFVPTGRVEAVRGPAPARHPERRGEPHRGAPAHGRAGGQGPGHERGGRPPQERGRPPQERGARPHASAVGPQRTPVHGAGPMRGPAQGNATRGDRGDVEARGSRGPDRRPPDARRERRREAPGPEVVRVVRPPLGSGPAKPAGAPHPVPHAAGGEHPGGAGQREAQGGGHRRRRRRGR